MSRSMSGSTKAKNTIVATPAAKKLGHRIAPTRCAIGRGGWSKRGSVKSVTGWLSPARRAWPFRRRDATATRRRRPPGASGFHPAYPPRAASRRGDRKSAVAGKGVFIGVDRGGGVIIKKQKTRTKE